MLEGARQAIGRLLAAAAARIAGIPLKKGGRAALGLLPTVMPDSPAARYRLRDAYYENNEVFRYLEASGLYKRGSKTRGIRNPVHRLVEFYAAHLWPGSLDKLPLLARTKAIEDAAREILVWSNWGARKQVAARWLPKHGDLFLKVEEEDEAVPIVLVEPYHVTDFEKDSKGRMKWIRLDIAIPAQDGRTRTRTEFWSASDGGFVAVWEHDLGEEARLSDLGDAIEEESGYFDEFELDAVPFFHAPYQDVGEKRGTSAFDHALEGINELNKMASRAHDMFFRFNKPLTAVSRNEAGRGAVTVEELTPAKRRRKPDDNEIPASGDIEIGDGEDREVLIQLPDLASIEQLVPNLPYDAAIGLMKAQEEDLQDDLPELLYYSARDRGDPSGRALRLILAAAVDRAKEARGNGEEAILQALDMALTISIRKGLFSIPEGDYGLWFEERDVLPVSDLERHEADRAKLEVLELEKRLGVLTEERLKEAGYEGTVTESEPTGAIAAARALLESGEEEVDPGDDE